MKPVEVGECERCHILLRVSAYEFPSPHGRLRRCLRCALLYPAMLRRSIIICLIVGTILTGINQGNLLLNGDFPQALYWKIPLTYAVPFCVATAGAIMASKSRE